MKRITFGTRANNSCGKIMFFLEVALDIFGYFATKSVCLAAVEVSRGFFQCFYFCLTEDQGERGCIAFSLLALKTAQEVVGRAEQHTEKRQVR